MLLFAIYSDKEQKTNSSGQETYSPIKPPLPASSAISVTLCLCIGSFTLISLHMNTKSMFPPTPHTIYIEKERERDNDVQIVKHNSGLVNYILRGPSRLRYFRTHTRNARERFDKCDHLGVRELVCKFDSVGIVKWMWIEHEVRLEVVIELAWRNILLLRCQTVYSSILYILSQNLGVESGLREDNIYLLFQGGHLKYELDFGVFNWYINAFQNKPIGLNWIN